MHLERDQMVRRLSQLAELESHLTFRISRLGKLLEIHASAELAGSGLNLTGYRILLVLSIFEETTAADLSRLMVIDRAQISRAISEMTRTGLVLSRADPGSKRQRLLSLTETGSQALNEVMGRFVQRQSRLESLLDSVQLAAFSEALDIMSTHLADELRLPDARPTRQD